MNLDWVICKTVMHHCAILMIRVTDTVDLLPPLVSGACLYSCRVDIHPNPVVSVVNAMSAVSYVRLVILLPLILNHSQKPSVGT